MLEAFVRQDSSAAPPLFNQPAFRTKVRLARIHRSGGLIDGDFLVFQRKQCEILVEVRA